MTLHSLDEKDLLIGLAIYINDSIENELLLIKCLEQLRKLYPKNKIVAVNNSSVKINWILNCKNLNIEVLHNNSPIFRYEMGAYKLIIEKYKAKKYILMQGNIFLNEKIDHYITNQNNKPEVCAFKLSNDSYIWSLQGVMFTNDLLNKININIFDHPPGVFYFCSLVCNDLFLNKMISDKLFDIECNTKNHSCAFERILSVYSNKIINCKEIKQLPENVFNKYFFKQETNSI